MLLAYAGEGGDGGCFIQLSEDSTITGFTIYYPNQDPKQVPKPYPWYACMGYSLQLISWVDTKNCKGWLEVKVQRVYAML